MSLYDIKRYYCIKYVTLWHKSYCIKDVTQWHKSYCIKDVTQWHKKVLLYNIKKVLLYKRCHSMTEKGVTLWYKKGVTV